MTTPALDNVRFVCSTCGTAFMKAVHPDGVLRWGKSCACTTLPKRVFREEIDDSDLKIELGGEK